MELHWSKPLKSREIDIALKGVKGWLLFLCISWTILYPAVSVISVGINLAEVPTYRQYADIVPLLVPVTVLDSVLGLIVAGFSMLAGIRLWRVLPSAVETARQFLYVVGVYQIVSALMIYIAFPAEFTQSMGPDVLSGVIRSLIYVAIWFAYFSRSRRVAATYGSPT